MTEDIGEFKSKALAERLARSFNRSIRYSTGHFDPQAGSHGYLYPRTFLPHTLLIGCVDNAEARLQLQQARQSMPHGWWIDAGNGKDWGQILVGNVNKGQGMRCAFQGNVCKALPDPATQRPDILSHVPEEPPDVDCAAAVDLMDQDPTINQMMATLTVHTVRRVLNGTCNYMALYVDLPRGAVSPQYATPESAARPFRMDPATLSGHHTGDDPHRCPNCNEYVPEADP